MYRSSFSRQDHTEMLLSILPTVVFGKGRGYEEGFLSSNFTFFGMDYRNREGGESYHSLTVAKTGSGKGVMNCARILQLFGLGYDFYAIEIGSTYEFLFRLLGGKYVTIDPDNTVINPFPSCAEAEQGLSVGLITPTVRALARILTDGKNELNIHELALCELAMKQIYNPLFLKEHGITLAPTLAHFYSALETLGEQTFNDEQKQARDKILANLYSFLKTSIGERFKYEDNLVLDVPLFGADFKRIKDEPPLLMAYLTFLSIRYGQKALFRRTPTFIVIDELHEFIRIDTEIIRTLCAQIARMGRKESGYISLITQEMGDIATLDSSLINQMHIVNLLYTESGHDQARKHFPQINERAYEVWSSYHKEYVDHRPAMLGVADGWFDLFLTYPREILALADTGAKALTLKEELMRNCSTMEEAYKELLKNYAS